MKSSVILLSLIFTSRCLFAQCPEVTLGILQALEKAEPSEKHAKIIAYGFDLTGTSANIQRYNRCWLTTSMDGKAYYEQILLLRTATNDLTFLTSKESAFLQLQQAIEERHSNTGTIVVGKMFQYQFVEQKIDAIPYYGLIISLRTQH
ncbi:MAG: hypothetical protein IT262_13125 [Saprospiraceae bacterium]|nr:hypothetical protein [Saprospiraceae bacterium]MCC6281540.1 hypothetical protein [Saprospiraceae bacterium]